MDIDKLSNSKTALFKLTAFLTGAVTDNSIKSVGAFSDVPTTDSAFFLPLQSYITFGGIPCCLARSVITHSGSYDACSICSFSDSDNCLTDWCILPLCFLRGYFS